MGGDIAPEALLLCCRSDLATRKYTVTNTKLTALLNLTLLILSSGEKYAGTKPRAAF